VANELKGRPGRGGNRHPLSVMDFIIEHLTISGEDYIANMHRAYKFRLDTLAAERLRRKPYHKPSYHSFEVKVLQLAREGKVEFSDRTQNSDNARVERLERKPVRRFYRLKK
jgi:hypothetical protein